MTKYARPGFKEIPGFPGYWINRKGEVRSQHRIGGNRLEGKGGTVISDRIWRKLLFREDKRNGRILISLQQNGKKRTMKRAVLLLTTFVGPRPPGMQCCHANDVNTDDRLSNLRWDTLANNIRDRIKNGGNPAGERNGRAKLTDDDVREIRRLHLIGLSTRNIASMFPVSKSMVAYICRGDSWANVR
jgi:hypothetical protein